MSESDKVTVKKLKEIWKKDFLPRIISEIKKEVQIINVSLEALTKRCEKIEQSQNFLSDKYDSFNEIIKDTKMELTSVKNKIKVQETSLTKLQQSNQQIETTMDGMQQYLRRDCLEITGVSLQPAENPKSAILEIATRIGANVTEEHISTAHRLPDTRKVRNRIIVKFTHKDKRDEMYRNRKKLTERSLGNGDNSPNERIYINESLTSYRKKLFGRIYLFKKKHSF